LPGSTVDPISTFFFSSLRTDVVSAFDTRPRTFANDAPFPEGTVPSALHEDKIAAANNALP
jgi:hypothetical protein